MALEEIIEIKNVEKKAEEIITSARAQADSIVKKAKEEARSAYNEELKLAKQKARNIVINGMEEGNLEAESILLKGEEENFDIKNISESVKGKAVNIIVERIVRNYGNS